MQLTIQIISYCRLNATADRIFRGALKDSNTTWGTPGIDYAVQYISRALWPHRQLS